MFLSFKKHLFFNGSCPGERGPIAGVGASERAPGGPGTRGQVAPWLYAVFLVGGMLYFVIFDCMFAYLCTTYATSFVSNCHDKSFICSVVSVYSVYPNQRSKTDIVSLDNATITRKIVENWAANDVLLLYFKYTELY